MGRLSSILNGLRAKLEPEPEVDYEVYRPEIWDLNSRHSKVEFTGSKTACEEFVAYHTEKAVLAIRPLGITYE